MIFKLISCRAAWKSPQSGTVIKQMTIMSSELLLNSTNWTTTESLCTSS